MAVSMSILYCFAVWAAVQAALVASLGMLDDWPCKVTFNGQPVKNDNEALTILRNGVKHSVVEVEVAVPCGGFLKQKKYFMRAQSSDFDVWRDVGMLHEFQFIDRLFPASTPPKTILDLGANVGFASVYFTSRFPQAAIASIEPSMSNFATASINVLGNSAVTLTWGAVWEQEQLLAIKPVVGDRGEWGVSVGPVETARGVRPTRVIPSYSVPYLMAHQGWDHIDYLKVDIETGEKYLFSNTSLAGGWLSKVSCLSVELHERFEPGCCVKPFRDAMQAYNFNWLFNTGELEVYCKAGHTVPPP